MTKEGAELLHWEQDLLGLELVESQFPGAGVGVATTAKSQFKKGGTYYSIHWAILGFIKIRNRSVVSPNVFSKP